MSKRHNNIKRLAHRTIEEVKSSAAIGRICGLNEGINVFRAKIDLQVMNRNGFIETPRMQTRLIRKHEAVMSYLENLLSDFASSYEYCRKLDSIPKGMDGKIWMCWWQGMESAPEIVRACAESVKKNSAGREVIVISDENISKYVELPEWVIDLQRRGVLSRTHMSDYLRLELLSRYGGLWLDSTFFCCGPLVSSLYDAPIFSVKRPDYRHGSIAAGYFANYALGCDEEHRYIFLAIKNLFAEYWNKSEYLIDYLLTDYLIVMAERHSSAICDAFASIKPNNSHCDDLQPILGDVYSSDTWDSMKQDTLLFKLTWKQSFKKEIKNKKTFYGKIIEGTL